MNFSCFLFLFSVRSGSGKEEAGPTDSLDGKPKQLKFPNQVYIDLPLWKDEQGEAGTGGSCSGGSMATSAMENHEDAGTSASSTASTTPQHTPTNSLKRASGRRRLDAILHSCAALLASVALGTDLRSPPGGGNGEEPEPREERKKREGLFQRATRFRRSTSPPSGGGGGSRSRKDEMVASSLSPLSSSSSGPVNLLSMSAISECNSTKCLLHSDSEGPEPSPVKEAPPVSLAKTDAAVEHTPNPSTSSSLLRRKKSNPAVTQTGEGVPTACVHFHKS